MHPILIQNLTLPLEQPIQADYCHTFTGRLRGLMFHPGLGSHQGLLLVQLNQSRLNASIHMLFMRFDIAAIWIDDDWKVVDRRLAKKWQLFCLPAHPARYVLEAHPHRLEDFNIGDQLVLMNKHGV